VISPHHQTEIEAIWNYTFDNKLRVDPSEYNVLFTEPPNNPKDAREAIIRYAFETRQVAGAYIGLQPMLALYASGRTTGIVVDSGFGVTHVTPIFEGVVQKIGISRLELAGRDLTNLTAQLLRLQPEKDFYLAQTIKEETCYVKSSPDSDAPDTINYTLPDGSTIAVNESRDLVPEALFEPPATQPDILGIPAIIDKSISECDLSIQLALLSNIVLVWSLQVC
jgi:actin-related protein